MPLENLAQPVLDANPVRAQWWMASGRRAHAEMAQIASEPMAGEDNPGAAAAAGVPARVFNSAPMQFVSLTIAKS